MLKSNDFRVFSVQTALFLSSSCKFTQSNFLASILQEYAERFNGAVQAFPLNDDAPPEIPRIILQSNNKQWKLQASHKRIDIFWFAGTLESATFDKEFAECIGIIEHILDTIPSHQVERLGFLLTQVCKLENPSQALSQHFCRQDVQGKLFRDSEDFEVHNHTIQQLGTLPYSVNVWVRCKTGKIPSTGESIAIVEQDINTLIEEDKQEIFDLEMIKEYYQVSKSEMGKILAFYFE